MKYVTLAGSRVKISDLPPDIAAAVLAELHPEPEPTGTPQLAPEPPQRAEPAPESARVTIARPGPTAPVVDVLPVAEAGTLERNGEDLQYLGGHWFHRCGQCGEWERLLLIRRGRNPVNVLQPVFRVPRGEPIRHKPECPHAGQF